MSLIRAVVSVVSIFLGLSAAVAQQLGTATNNAAASASSALTNPPVFQGLMVDAKGKTVGRLFIGYSGGFPTSINVVRQINGIWMTLPVGDFRTGFQISAPTEIVYLYQSIDCTGQTYFFVNQAMFAAVTSPALGIVMEIPPATAPSIYFAGTPMMVNVNSFRDVGGPCQPWGANSNPTYVGPVETVPVSSLGLTLPFSIK
jgi:hypothetical protein